MFPYIIVTINRENKKYNNVMTYECITVAETAFIHQIFAG